MNSIFDVILYIFEWCSDTSYVPITILDQEFTFTILELLLVPCFAALTIFIVNKIIELAND